MEKINVGLVGLGWWGTKLLRNFQNHPLIGKIYSYDISQQAINNVLDQLQHFEPVESFNDLLSKNTSCLVIATPPQTHFQLSQTALERGKNVLVTKPPSETLEEFETLAQLATERKLVFMVDATYIFNPAVNTVSSLLEQYGAGNLMAIRILRFGDDLRMHHIERLQKTMFANNIDIINDLAFHDISILIHLFGNKLEIDSIKTFNTLHESLSDSAFIFFKARDIPGVIEYSWSFPERRREYQFYYQDRFLVFDDLNPKEKIWEFTYEDKKKTAFKHEESEPLFCEIDHFLTCVQSQSEPEAGIPLMKNIMKSMMNIKALMEKEK